MSSQFSYELDERQIKILMQSGEVDFNDAAWQRFESNINKEVSSSSISNFTPKINFGISRSIIVPILFIGLIGGLSVILFSFVDFKKKEEPVTEVSLKIAPPVVRPASPKKETAKILAPVKLIKDSVIAAATPTVQSVAKPVIPVITEAKKEPVTVAKKTEAKPEPAIAVKTVIKEENAAPKKKRKRKVVSESIQSISAPTRLNSESDEPELQLK